MIIIFSRSAETNGIGEIRRALPLLDPDFVAVGGVREFVRTLWRNRRKVQAVFTLAASDLLLSMAIARALGVPARQISGAYHFKEWEVMLNERFSAMRARVFRRLMRTFPAQNLIFVSELTRRASDERIPLNGESSVIVMPVLWPQRTSPYRAAGDNGRVEIVTVGRFVDFKISSVLRMMRVVDGINAKTGGALRYTVYGEGPCADELADAPGSLRMPELVEVRGRVPREEFARVVSEAQVFFGMGTAVIQAAMLETPSLIAVAYEDGPVTHGWFSERDHEASPTFGDPAPSARAGLMETYIEDFLAASASGRAAIGRACAQAALPYEGRHVARRIKEVARAALPHDPHAVDLFDVLLIRLEIYWARFMGKKGIQS